MKRVALIAAIREGMLLMGKRNDNGKWTMPGGHLHEGEEPVDGARRELKEETGLSPEDELKLVDRRVRDGVEFFTFECKVDGTPTGKGDPDKECSTWAFFDVENGIPKGVNQNMAGPKKDNVLGSLYGLEKHEQDDEVDRMLTHPNRAERRMALKLGTVKDKHLIRALQDEDPGVQRAAFNHPGMSSNVLHALMRMPNREHLQIIGLQHPHADLSHVKALYGNAQGNKKLLNAITHHADLDGPFIQQMFDDGNGSRDLVANLRAPAEMIQKIIEAHFTPGHDKSGSHRNLVMEALKHPHAPPHLVEKALKEGGDDGVRLAAANSHNLPESAAEDMMKRGQLPHGAGEGFIRFALVTSPHATDKRLSQGLEDSHPRVRAGVFATKSPNLNPSHIDRAIDKADQVLIGLGMNTKHAGKQHVEKMLQSKHPEIRELGKLFSEHRKEGLKKYAADLNTWLEANKLEKAVKPLDFAGIVRASDPAGRQLVEHKPHLESHPPEHTDLVQAYRTHVLNSPQKVKRVAVKKNAGAEGITRKHLYEIPETVQSHGGQKFMVKPYHERIIGRVKNWQKHPHQGWAEMAHQGLYHAAGIGDLHQKVHTSEHNMGNDLPNEPALVVAMEKEHRPVFELGYGAYKAVSPKVKEDTRKIALMDFLTNNLDRHGANLLLGDFQKDKSGPFDVDKANAVKAIDHSRSFQYSTGHTYKWEKPSKQPREMDDNFGDYVRHSAIGEVAPLLDDRNHPRLYDREMQSLRDYAPTFDWWGEVSPKVREEMNKHLEQIKDPNVRDHIRRNFNARADWLDERSNFGLENYGTDWYKDPVPIYKPGQLTDEEKAERERGG